MGANVDAKDSKGLTPLIVASSRGQNIVAGCLLAFQANPDLSDDKQGRPLDRACQEGHVDVVRLRLERGARLETTSNDGRATPLITACANGRRDMLMLLLERGADIEARDRNYHSGLYFAVYYNHEDIVQILLDRGADVNARAQDGDTILHCAASKGNIEIIQILLDRGANINARVGRMAVSAWNYQGETPLQWACASRKEAAVRLLLERGADAEIRDKNGRTAAEWAKARGCQEVVRLLSK